MTAGTTAQVIWACAPSSTQSGVPLPAQPLIPSSGAAVLFAKAAFVDLRRRVAGAVVLLEVLLRNPVKRQRGHRSLQTRGGHAPVTGGAAPAGEAVALNPDQTSRHDFGPEFQDWYFGGARRTKTKKLKGRTRKGTGFHSRLGCSSGVFLADDNLSQARRKGKVTELVLKHSSWTRWRRTLTSSVPRCRCHNVDIRRRPFRARRA